MMRILGCWYSTAQIHHKILLSSLRSLDVAQQSAPSGAVTVKTCTWKPIPGNPFEEYIANHPQPSHLGIVTQIARNLLEAQAAGCTYDAVCFLEHDVLYPHDYFDQVARQLVGDSQARGIRNENYIGMNHTGWLAVESRGEPPMHQLTLRWDVAWAHLDSLMRKCILHGGICLEPADSPEIVHRSLDCAGPACHINHGRHFTNHHESYAGDSGGAHVHPYWGDFRQYYPEGVSSVPEVAASTPRVPRSGVVIGHFNRLDFLELNLRYSPSLRTGLADPDLRRLLRWIRSHSRSGLCVRTRAGPG